MLILGIIGGVLGVVISIFTIIIGWIGWVANESPYLIIAGFATLLCSIAGIIAGVISNRRLRLASIMFIVSGGVGSLIVTAYPVAGILFIISGVLGMNKLRQKNVELKN